MMYNYPFYPFLEEDTLLTTTDIQVIVTILLKIVLFQIKIILVSVKKIKSREQKWWHAFEIFGLKLHSDDVLLMGLLFFLYNEKVDDQYLFIALILLLLS